jgi:transposase
MRILTDPAGASRQIQRILLAEKGNKAAAARRLRVDYRTFKRWVKKLAERGYPVEPERPMAGKPSKTEAA